MPAHDSYHDIVKRALVKDGWTITHDPYRLVIGLRNLYVDLGAEQLLGAEQGERRIAVEIKMFRSASLVTELERALGQFVLYSQLMTRSDPDRRLFLAIDLGAYSELFQEPIGQMLIENDSLRLLVFDTRKEEIRRWIP